MFTAGSEFSSDPNFEPGVVIAVSRNLRFC